MGPGYWPETQYLALASSPVLSMTGRSALRASLSGMFLAIGYGNCAIGRRVASRCTRLRGVNQFRFIRDDEIVDGQLFCLAVQFESEAIG